MSVGVGVDMTRMTLARSALQSAVDGAALAAAAAGGYSTNASSADTNATYAATGYFNGNYTHGGQGPSVSLMSVACPSGPPSSLCITPPPTGSSGYKVSVAAQGTMSTTFLGVAKLVGGTANNSSITTVTIKAQATANNVTTPGTSPQVVINSGHVNANAGDWNTGYLYAVPLDANGNPNFLYIPTGSQLYRLGTNCTPGANIYCSSSAAKNCNIVDANDASTATPAVTPNQPLAILIINVTNGRGSPSDVTGLIGGYQANGYGAKEGSCQVFATANLSVGQSPSQYSDSIGTASSNYTTSAYILNTINAAAISRGAISQYIPPPGQTTAYSILNTSTANNCSLIIQNIDPNSSPQNPPYSGSCFSSTSSADTQSGKQFANLSCAQTAGRTFMYWLNDMGGVGEDFDYNDLSFSLRCTGGGSSSTPGSATTPVTLLK